MREALVAKAVLSTDVPASRAFHYSKGPFEGLLDATDYLRVADGDPVAVDELSFVAYARAHGYTAADLLGVVRSPICRFELPDGSLVEENIFTYTTTDTYAKALSKLASIRSQLWIR